MNMHRVTSAGATAQQQSTAQVFAVQPEGYDIPELISLHCATSGAFRGAVAQPELDMTEWETISDVETAARDALLAAPCVTLQDVREKAAHFLARFEGGERDFFDDDAVRSFLHSLVGLSSAASPCGLNRFGSGSDLADQGVVLQAIAATGRGGEHD